MCEYSYWSVSLVPQAAAIPFDTIFLFWICPVWYCLWVGESVIIRQKNIVRHCYSILWRNGLTFFPESISKACDAITGVYPCCNLLDHIIMGKNNERKNQK